MSRSTIALGFGVASLFIGIVSLAQIHCFGEKPVLLSQSELAATFGDACSPCVIGVSCSTGYTGSCISTSGTCSYCDNASEIRTICCPVDCNAGYLTNCVLNGSPVDCGNVTYFTGQVDAGLGTCGSCNVASPKANGLCSSLLNATGNNCNGCHI